MPDTTTTKKTRFVRPRASVNETKDGKLRVILEMPGVNKEGLEVRIEKNELRISGKRETPVEGTYVLRERSPGDFLADLHA